MSPMVPPTAPNVAAQMSPVADYVGGLVGVQQNPAQSFNPMEFALMRLAESAKALEDVAMVLKDHKPVMLGVLKVMVEAGSALMSDLQAALAATGPAPGASQLPVAEQQPTTGTQMLSMG